MEEITEIAFRKMKLGNRFSSVKKYGNYLASRFFESYHVHLYALGNYKVEVWYRISLNHLCYIEVVGNPETLHAYVDEIDLKELGL